MEPDFADRISKLKAVLWTAAVFRDDISKTIFDHIRNVSLSMLVGWAGLLLVVEPYDSLERPVGICLAIAGPLLLLLNMGNGIRRILDSKLSGPVKVIACTLAVALTIGLFVVLARQQILHSSPWPVRNARN